MQTVLGIRKNTKSVSETSKMRKYDTRLNKKKFKALSQSFFPEVLVKFIICKT